MWGNEIRIFHANVTKSQGPTMYTSTTVCSLCIVKLQQRHSELVNGAITSNNMSYLTKTLSHCHWMCFTSNKEKKCFVRASCAFSSSIFLSLGVSLKSETCSPQCPSILTTSPCHMEWPTDVNICNTTITRTSHFNHCCYYSGESDSALSLLTAVAWNYIYMIEWC